ncbi:hypothetical protein QBC39DRAFT_420764 [Podospora conica]|nr:hypothetical protein QBC39DRAFT_420764 [Schizothecium conicum]
MPPQQATTSLPTMAKQSTPKTMSSRLMTMKFMQRGAALAAASPSTPKTDDDNDDEGSASKRRKTQHNPASSAPGTPTAATPLFAEHQAIRAALEEEERKRLVAVEKRAAELGDSHWVLDGARHTKKASAPLKIVQVGYAQIDYAGTRDDDDAVDLSTKARFQYNMKSKTPTKEESKDDSNSDSDDSDADSSSSSNSDSDSEASPASKTATLRGRHPTDDTPASKRRARSIIRNDERQRKSRELAAARRKKEVNLNQLTSISGASVQQHRAAASSSSSSSFTCHKCGKPGHKMAECPQGGGSSKRQKR